MNNRSHLYNFIKNTGYAFLAQIVSLLLSITTSLILPKFLGIKEFGFWQLFLFYASYVGIFNLGLIDGIYLKIGGKEYNELEFKDIGTQFKILCSFMALITFLIIAGQNFFIILEPERRYTIVCTAIYILLANISWFIEYVFQATYKIKNFALSTMIDKTSFLLLMMVGICLFPNYLLYFFAGYLVSRFISFLYLAHSAKEIIRAEPAFSIKNFRETGDLIKIGINLTISSISGMLILGINRKVIDIQWGIESFGKFSLAISLCNFFLVFIQQISKVLFPVLRRADSAGKILYYGMLRTFLNILLPFSFVLYVPVKMILGRWIPQYEMSFRYLAFLLPICLFDGKMQLLCNTYFKVLRQEKFLLRVNLFSMALSLAGAILGGWVIKSMLFIMIGMVVAISVRSIISEWYLEKCLGQYDKKVPVRLGAEVLLAVLFILTAWNLEGLSAFLIISFIYILYLIFNRMDIKAIFQQLKQQLTVI